MCFRGWRKGCGFIVNGVPEDAAYFPETNTYVVTLPEMSPGDTAAITVTHEDGLIHDNSDVRERIIERLIRAQINQDDKLPFLRWADEAIQLPPERLRPLSTRPDLQPTLGAHLYELITQL